MLNCLHTFWREVTTARISAFEGVSPLNDTATFPSGLHSSILRKKLPDVQYGSQERIGPFTCRDWLIQASHEWYRITPIFGTLGFTAQPAGKPPLCRSESLPNPGLLQPVQDVEYFKKYYHAHLAQLARCDICNSCISIQKMKRHKASKRCEKLKLIPLKVV